MAQSYVPREWIEDLRNQVDLVEIVSEAGIALRRRGKNYFGLCPFHQEDTPSFSVSPERQWFHCFGCHESGNVFHFLMKMEGLTFPEALQRLAERVGMTLPGTSHSEPRPQIVGLRELHAFALKYFHRQLMDAGTQAMRYLRDRGVKMETIRHFKLGYAPPGWDHFMKAALRAGFGLQLLVEGGLIRSVDGKRYDTFRNRIIFPIYDEQGNPVAFGGRALDENPAKYLNSPETPIYQKSRILYNLHAARSAIQRAREAILVEGYLDALIPYQEGIQNVVASLGTALSEHHARTLSRYADCVVVAYDGDEAGFNAALRGLQLLLQENLRVRIANLPDGIDPDDLVRRRGTRALRDQIQRATNLVPFQIQLLCRQQDRNVGRPDEKAQIVRELASTLAHVQSLTELGEYVHQAAADLRLDEALLWQELQRLGVRVRPQRRFRTRRRRESPRARVERRLLECIFQEPALLSEAREVLDPESFSVPAFTQIARKLWSWEGGDSDLQRLVDECEDRDLRGVMMELAWETIAGEDVRNIFHQSLQRLRDYILKDLELARRQAVAQSDDLEALKVLLELRARRKQQKSHPPLEETAP